MKVLITAYLFLFGLVSSEWDSIEDLGSIDLPNVCSGSQEIGADGKLRCSEESKPWLAAAANATSGLRWEDPHECVGEACVFSDAKFAGGIVAVTTAANARRMAEFPVGDSLPDRVPPFTEAMIPGKGRGLIANRTIKRGEIIFTLNPVMTVQIGPPLGSLPMSEKVPLYNRAVEVLPTAARDSFNSQIGEDAAAKIDKNCFMMPLHHSKDDSGDHLGCFPMAARMNHDCRPKCDPPHASSCL